MTPEATKDIYSLLSDEGKGKLQVKKLTASQVSANIYCRDLLHGVGVITGPPGSGKTEFLVQTILPMLYDSIHPIKFETRVLIVTPNNHPADELAQRLYDEAQLHDWAKEAIIIRAYALPTEVDHIRYQSRTSNPNFESPNLIDEEEIATPSELTVAPLVYQLCKESTFR